MTAKELEKKIHIILSQVDGNTTIYGWTPAFPPDSSKGPLDVALESIQQRELKALQFSNSSQPFLAKPGEAEVANKQILLLRTLYGQCLPNYKKIFSQLLMRSATPANGRLIANCILSLGSPSELSPFLLNPSRAVLTVASLLKGIDEKLEMESHTFTETDLDILETLLSKINETTYHGSTLAEIRGSDEIHEPIRQHVDWIRRRISGIRYIRLEKTLLEGENPEINTDKEVLISRLETLGFRKEIAAALQQLDKKLYQAGTPLDFKGCMDLIRTIYEEIIEDAAKGAATKIGEHPPDYPKKAFNPWNNYLRKVDVLEDAEHELTQKLYSYLSNAGAHVLGSAPEQVRVTKNMVIELGLMILGRIQNLGR